jgi:hypothetical protein
MEELNLPNPRTHMVYGPPEFSLLTSKRTWDKVRTVMREIKIKGLGWTPISKCKIPGIYKYTLSPNYFAFTIASTQMYWYAMDYDQIMMINDTINSRILSIIYNRMSPENTPGKLDEELLIPIYDIWDNRLVKYGNDTYEIAMWESCCMTVMYNTHE